MFLEELVAVAWTRQAGRSLVGRYCGKDLDERDRGGLQQLEKWLCTSPPVATDKHLDVDGFKLVRICDAGH
jgi:hypothetical protein